MLIKIQQQMVQAPDDIAPWRSWTISIGSQCVRSLNAEPTRADIKRIERAIERRGLGRLKLPPGA